ncbi:hypothetical protein SAY86_012465 [Trapa natans]|uniref:Protein FAR1-RELATED SEQUENCE n=1 Tax=Trapa natans TaxID=22666 RepID=A0AAN7LWR0_TRANT|nr:hypothetical protein SAY86_012465 [Trapa natans]
MDIDLRLPSGEHEKEEGSQVIDNMLDTDEKLENGDIGNANLMVVADVTHAGGAGIMSSSAMDMLEVKEYVNLEPLSGMEFESHGEAYSFYQEYARSMGFTTAIQNSRRSKTTREFIDAKFACSKYGTKRDYEKSFNNRQRARQSKKDAENGTGRRTCAKTDCKASMHVKRRSDGKWVIHSFVKEHNHDLLPAQAISEQTRKMYADMARKFAEYTNVMGLKTDSRSLFDRSRNITLESGEARILLNFFLHMQCLNPNFFYAVDLGDDQRIKNLLWVDAKSRHDYSSFCDAVCFDTTYMRNKYKLPLALFIGVNQHYQFILLGCALISDECAATYAWIMQTWLKAVGGQPPKVIITEQDKIFKSIISDVFPATRHCFYLWQIWDKVSENLGHVIKNHEKFLAKFEKCVNRSWTEEDFEKRWWKIVDRTELKDDEWMQTLYEDRKLWIPTFIKDVFLAGMCTIRRAESVNSFFDKYVHKKTSAQEFVKQYESFLQDRYEEEGKADSDTWTKQSMLKSPSPFEKSVSGLYTLAVFKKFQVEVLGAVACHPKEERQDENGVTFRVHDVEKNQEFTVTWNEMKSEVSCMCRMFEYRGYLCRHALVVLQMRGLSAIPSTYILKRWTKDAKNRHLMIEQPDQLQSRVQRYNDLCQRAMRLSEEASMSPDSYSLAVRSLEETFGTCVSMNNSNKSLAEGGSSGMHGLLCMEDDTQNRSIGMGMSMSMNKTNKKKNPTKKRKVNSEQDIISIGPQEGLQQMEKLTSRTVSLDGYYGTPQTVQGMVQLNLMAPTRDNYYGNQQTIQGLGQLNSIGPTHDGYYTPQPSIHGLAQMDFFRPANSYAFGIRDDPNVRAAQMHEEASRHA